MAAEKLEIVEEVLLNCNFGDINATCHRLAYADIFHIMGIRTAEQIRKLTDQEWKSIKVYVSNDSNSVNGIKPFHKRKIKTAAYHSEQLLRIE